jgi:hypothetical protein
LVRPRSIDIHKRCEEAKDCRLGIAQGISALGYEISRADIETARQNGGIESIRAAEVTKGYGLISLAQIRVWGE